MKMSVSPSAAPRLAALIGAALLPCFGVGLVMAAEPPAFVPAPASPEVHFSGQPTDDEIIQARIFEEPLVLTDAAVLPGENAALATALAAYQKANLAAGPSGPGADLAPFERFLRAYPNTRWGVAIQTDLGLEYYRRAAFGRALAAWRAAWDAGKGQTQPRVVATADRALAELARMEARVGDAPGLETLLTETASRPLQGRAAQTYSEAKGCLWTMQHHPEESFKCGPWALDGILSAAAPAQPYRTKIKAVASTPRGLSLAAVAGLAKEMGMDLTPARRQGTAGIVPVPAVVHWKLDHYGALLRSENGRYLLQDPTFGGNPQWVSQSVLDEESSGYFLVPAKTLLAGAAAAGWSAVPEAEAQTVWGKGPPQGYPSGGGGPSDPKAKKPPRPPKPDQPCPTCPPRGMAASDVSLADCSLNIDDTPLGYQPPVGPAILFILNYGQREGNQPTTLTYSNLGPGWNLNWITTLTFDSNNAYVNCGGGGIETFPNFTSSSQASAPTLEVHSRIVAAGPNVYQEVFVDGSMNVFALRDGSGRYYLTQYTDQQGNSVRLAYDSQYRLMTITDAIGQVSVLSYELAADPLKITKITDPFGRTAVMGYNANNQLAVITDAQGMQSQFAYGSANFIQTLTTGYGTTSFASTESGQDRTLTTTLPDGSKEMVQSLGGPVAATPASEAATPAGMSVFNLYLNDRNTYYWDRKAMLEAPGDVTQARISHFLHGDNLSKSLVIESEKDPLENRTWLRYQGQTQPGFTNAAMLDNPTQIGRVLDDGTTQITQLSYNALGNVTQQIDPAGRTTNYVYAANGIDVLQVFQTTAGGGTGDLTRTLTYNGQHLPLTATDAAGQTTTMTYNAAGQLLTILDAKNQTTQLTYDAKGFLTSITGPQAGTTQTTSFTYDAVGRVRTVSDAVGYTLTYAYDNLDRRTGITYPDGTQCRWTYTLLDITQETDQLNRATNYIYDSVGQLVTITDPLNQVSHLEYCACGDLKSITDELGRKTQFLYDVIGRRIGTVYPDGSKTSVVYETTASRVHTRTDATGQVTTFKYNVDDTLNQVRYTNPRTLAPVINFGYDRQYRRITSVQDGVGTIAYTYNPANSLPGALKLARVKYPVGQIDYAYDVLGQLTSRTVDGSVQSTNYDALNRVSFTANALGTFVYNYVSGTRRPASVGFPNGQVTRYTYYGNNNDQLPSQIQHLRPDQAVLSQWNYAYDATDRITSWTQQRDSAASRVWTPGYDADNQLLSVALTNPAASYGYTYDAAGNRLTESTPAAAVTASYNSLNEVANVSPAADSDRTYEWDGENRLTAINYTGGSNRTEIGYDGLGRRISITEKSGASVLSLKRFVWDQMELCEELDGNGNVTKRFFPQGVQILGGASAGVYYYTRDHLGSIREMTDAGGNIRARYDYDPFGRRTKISGDLDADFGFTGYYYHSASGLSLAPLRAYDPNLGRWISRDPYGETASEEDGRFNLFAYVNNNTFNLVDPAGANEGNWAELFLKEARDFLKSANGEQLRKKLPDYNTDLINKKRITDAARAAYFNLLYAKCKKDKNYWAKLAAAKKALDVAQVDEENARKNKDNFYDQIWHTFQLWANDWNPYNEGQARQLFENAIKANHDAGYDR